MLQQDARRSNQVQSPEARHAEALLDAEVLAAHVRSYDHHDGHSVRVTVASPEEEVHLAERHYLAPGQSVSLAGGLDAGEYEVRVEVDGVERTRTRCRLDDTPSGTALIELGNGVVSVTDGVSLDG